MIEERFVILTAAGFDVVAGHKLNAEPLSRAAADRLAHEPSKAAANSKLPDRLSDNSPPPREAPPPKPSPNAAMSREEAMRAAAAEANAAMDLANSRPIPAAAFEVDRAASRGGSAGFSVNGVLLSATWPSAY
jgi:hypothetical protein